MHYAVKTLGCKVNQIESLHLAETLEELGFKPAEAGNGVDLCVINTCTVTAKTDSQCRQMIRRMVRENPGARVVVTGCYAAVAEEAIRAIPGVGAVMGNAEKGRARSALAREVILLQNGSGTLSSSAVSHRNPPVLSGIRDQAGLITGAGGRSRAFVRVQDGCQSFCAYCIVPYARGPVKSEDPDRVAAQFELLVDQGYPEVVLSGIHLGAYGTDRRERQGLAKLVRRLLLIPGEFRIRLSSVEATEVDANLIDLVMGEEKICRHLHIPLQSGDNQLLQRMKRPYSREAYEELVRGLRDRDPRMALGTDLIVGLPGETDESFEDASAFIAALPLTHFHVFPYSRRDGTEAAAMAGQVSAAVKKERARCLRELCGEKHTAFLSSMVGQTLDVVAIGDSEKTDGPIQVLSDNYMEGVLSDSGGSGAGRAGIFPVAVADRSGGRLVVEEVRHGS
ncbi:MAG: tRNA (N(6)-L-threonylcarbamoyladenosine(37)-C(2))-methylthiotransferase MtaB [bacterium]|nr:tRNA (N(6)-L-threonylcarbamoyladenosine(37)-C(2))-methylthiotransferase MtaB [bacterium]